MHSPVLLRLEVLDQFEQLRLCCQIQWEARTKLTVT
jgi:hypothetical protein